jgi:hypothetical protein
MCVFHAVVPQSALLYILSLVAVAGLPVSFSRQYIVFFGSSVPGLTDSDAMDSLQINWQHGSPVVKLPLDARMALYDILVPHLSDSQKSVFLNGGRADRVLSILQLCESPVAEPLCAKLRATVRGWAADPNLPAETGWEIIPVLLVGCAINVIASEDGTFRKIDPKGLARRGILRNWYTHDNGSGMMAVDEGEVNMLSCYTFMVEHLIMGPSLVAFPDLATASQSSSNQGCAFIMVKLPWSIQNSVRGYISVDLGKFAKVSQSQTVLNFQGCNLL